MTQKNILIIDDEKDIRVSVSAILNDENYNCYLAKNSDEAFKCIEEFKVDTIILDVWLNNSKLDGIEILKKLKIQKK